MTTSEANDSMDEQRASANGQRAVAKASLMRAIDDLLFDLEDLNVRGIDRVPATLRERAARIFGLLATSGADMLRPCTRVAPMVYMLVRAEAGVKGNVVRDAPDDRAALNCA